MGSILNWVDWKNFYRLLTALDSTVLLSHAFILIWCGGIFIYFVVLLMRLVWSAWSLWWALRTVNLKLASVKGPFEFTQGFEKYDQEVRSHRRLIHPWVEFTKSLVFPEPGSDDRLRTTGAVSQYLNASTVIAPRISTIFYHSVSNHLTGAGILGTFLGLAAGIRAGSQGLVKPDPNEVKNALQQLLDGASLAFITSICGIMTSLIFLFVERLSLSWLHSALENWVAGLEFRLLEVIPEHVALEQLHEAQRQTKQLERFNTDLVFALEQALEEKIAGRLAPQLEKLLQAVERLREDRSTDSSKAIEEMIGHFTQSLKDKTATEFDAMSATVGDLDRSLKASADAMQQTQIEVRQALDSIVHTVRSTLDSSASAMQEKLVRSLEDVERVIKSVSESLAQQIGDSSTVAADNLRSTFEVMSEEITESMDRVQQTISASTSAAAEQLNASSTTVAKQFHDNLTAVTQEMAQKGIDAASQIAASLQGFQMSVERLERSSQTSEKLLTGMNQFVDKLNTLRGTIESTHLQIVEIVEPVRSTLTDIRASNDRSANVLQSTSELVRRMEATIEDLGQQQGIISTAWKQYQDRFEGIDHSLQKVFSQLDDGLSRYTVQVTEFVKELDLHTASITQNIAAATGELNGAIEDLLEGLLKSRP